MAAFALPQHFHLDKPVLGLVMSLQTLKILAALNPKQKIIVGK
jgi:hypothetical protein